LELVILKINFEEIKVLNLKSYKMADQMSGDQEFLADEVKIIMKDVKTSL